MELDRNAPDMSISLLYISHFLSMWNARTFEFGAILFLATIYPNTLLPMSIYALLRALAAIMISPTLGRFIDLKERLYVLRVSILGQRIAVVCSCALFALLMEIKSSLTTVIVSLIFAALSALACIEKLCSIMNTVAIERDWLVVIAANDDHLLQNLNTRMRRIDLICKLLGPLVIALVHAWSADLAIWITATVNVFSVLFEYGFVAKVFASFPLLKKSRTSPPDESGRITDGSSIENAHLRPKILAILISTFAPWIAYTREAVFLPSLALSLLYLTVLSFSGQMTTFLLAIPQPKLTSATIGLLRTIATAAEISSTFIAPYTMAKIGPIRAGIWFLSWQALMLSPAVVVLWTDSFRSTPTAFFTFICALVASRIGLWSFDLCAQHIIQESVSPAKRGSFSAVEASLQNMFELCTFAMTIIFPHPIQFRYPALISLVAVYCSASVYAFFVRTKRGHLLHIPDCIKVVRSNGSEAYELVATEDQ